MYYGVMYARNTAIDGTNSCFVFGPRGTGKSYWLRRRFPEAAMIDLLEARTFNLLSADPQRLSSLIPSSSRGLVIVDEVQKLPELLDEVHRLMERDGTRFMLTGSSARKLKRHGINLLAGRALNCSFHPFTAEELGADFDLPRALDVGLLPSLYDPEKDVPADAYLQSYVHVYLKQEVIQEGVSRNLAAFSRFLEAASFSQAQLLNVAETARECQIKRKMCESYFDVLDDLLVGVRLPAFQKRARRRLVQHPKFFFFDAGVFRAIRPRGLMDRPAEIDGAALETLVFQHLRATLEWRFPGDSLYYWRTSNGTEVDFVVYGNSLFVAIEVKRSRNVTRGDLSGLRSFRNDYPEASALLLYGGDRELELDGVRIVPFERAFEDVAGLLTQ